MLINAWIVHLFWSISYMLMDIFVLKSNSTEKYWKEKEITRINIIQVTFLHLYYFIRFYVLKL